MKQVHGRYPGFLPGVLEHAKWVSWRAEADQIDIGAVLGHNEAVICRGTRGNDQGPRCSEPPRRPPTSTQGDLGHHGQHLQ
jgi:hypothetical protein